MLFVEISGYVLITRKMLQPELDSFANKLDGGIFWLQPPGTQNATSTLFTLFANHVVLLSFTAPDPVYCLHVCYPILGPH